MAQSTILPMHCKYAIYMEGNLSFKEENDMIQFKSAIKKFQIEVDEIQKKYPDAKLGGALAFGSDIWPKITTISKPPELKSINTLKYLPNTTQRDMLCHILTDHFDVAFMLAQDTLKNFGHTFKITQEVHGFRRVEERGLDGFVDGTENPEGDELRTKFGLVPAGQPHEFGSYVFTQRWEHHLENWDNKSTKYQEDTIGRTKKESEEIPEDKRPEDSHVSRTDLNEDGVDLKIIRQSLPYGTASTLQPHGLFFIAYATRLHNIEKQLESMFGKLDGKKDRVLAFTTPVSGSYYFAPSKMELMNL
ncbi:hypothetical protein DICPUDRAFT_35644 [Dictyostelium purpureum]|uniref:Dyp-type peroxidase family protein n=1 Tax=Dictyostelium purpureum TaxID=5786 RepID=F0ZPN1_DICPU|nr:uncharacterized protein DICPUDRAFT_35644 [Dictyostelium purpureum]EGC34082.1 hypothetical protein DICPUDRAFT_35644 [Dictyostelium purpureum]|eukprot:XP_003289375.1 hypothetical protein DICPUDRAFT_35644 [Dictyostelium purpureum]